jgi:adenylate cyclase
MWEKIKKQTWQWRGVLIAAPAVAAAVIGIRSIGWMQGWELGFLDNFFRFRPSEAIDERILIVEATEEDIRKLKWPLSDEKLAKLIEILKGYKPRVIGLDIYRDLPVEPGHEKLEKIFSSTPNLIGIQKVVGSSSGYAVNPPPTLSKLEQVSANDFVIDEDSRVRRTLLSVGDKDGNTFLTLGVQLALNYLEAEGIQLEQIDPNTQKMKLGKAVFMPFVKNDGSYVNTDAGGYQIIANFRNLKGRFRSITMSDVLEGRSPSNLIRDRIILIGITAESGGDYFYTPYSIGLLQQTSGVALHAEVASQLVSTALDGRPQISFWSDSQENIWIVTWSLVGAILAWTQRYRKLFINNRPKILTKIPITAISISLVSICLVGGCYLAFLQFWWIPVVPAFLALNASAITVIAYIARNTSGMRQAFGRYLTDEVVATLLETPGGFKIGGENKIVTILVCDLRGFSILSDQLLPQKLVEVINLYLEAMTNIVSKYKGTINDFMGDGIFIIFGAPITRENDVQRAVACAIAMQLEMKNLNHKLATMNFPSLGMGIGIHTGEVLAGNVGSQQRAKYTVMGSNVNMASRIETYTVAGQILVSEETYKQINSIVRMDSHIKVQPKGFNKSINIYEVGGIGDEYNMFLDQKKETLMTLHKTIPIHLQIIEDKHISQEKIFAHIVKLSSDSAMLRLPYPLEILTNIRINLMISDKNNQGLDIYAKITENLNENKTNVRVNFTVLPSGISVYFESILNSLSENI